MKNSKVHSILNLTYIRNLGKKNPYTFSVEF